MVADPALAVARAGSKIAAYTIKTILKALERLTGSTLRSDLADFATSFDEVLATLSERSTEVTEILRSLETLVVEVVRPDAYSVAAASALRASLVGAGLKVGYTIVNRLTPPLRPDAERATAAAAPEHASRPRRASLRAMRAIRVEETAAVAALEDLLASEGEARSRLLRLTASERGIDSLDELLELGERILGR